MALSDVTSNPSDETSDGLLYVPPRSSAFRTSLFPGFWSPGASPSANPNPVVGSDPVAAPTVGEFNYTPPAAPAAQSGLSSVTSNPVGTDGGGTSVDERASNQEQVAKSAGMVTDPGDFLRAAALGLSLTSPTGIAGLAANTAANLLGAPDEATDPIGALLGDARGNPWDLRSNINRRPGYNEEYSAGLKRGLSPQASLNAAKSATDPGSNAWSKSYGTQERSPSGAAPAAPAQDVTALNRQTGFQRQSTNGSGGATGAAPGTQQAPASSGFAGVTAPAVAAPAKATKNGPGAGGANANGGRSRGSDSWGSRGGTESRDPGSEGKYAKGGVVMKKHHKEAAKKNHEVVKKVAAKTGMTLPALVAKAKTGKGEMGKRARLEAHVMKLARGGVVRTGYAEGGEVADESMQYNPPAEMTEGDTDMVDAVLTPGELVVTKPAAEQYRPEVKAAINDPEKAAQINQIIEDFLNGEDEESEMDESDDQPGSEDGGGDDGAGMGVMKDIGTPAFRRPTSALAGVTKAA